MTGDDDRADGAPDIAVIILTFNEEKHIGRCLAALRGVVRHVFVVDGFSTDRTVEIARAGGAFVTQRRFVNYAQQFQWAIDNLPFGTEWVMRLDADEVVEPALADEIRRSVPGLPADVAGINLKRKHIFLGRWIRHGGRYPLVLLRIWRRGRARIEDRWMDEHIVLEGGRTVLFAAPFRDDNLNDLTFFTDKHNRYATREAIDALNQRHRLFARDEGLTEESRSGSRQAAVKRGLKERLYNRIPFPLAAAGYFLYRYVVQLGFLDGREGLVYHGLQGFWYRFLVGAKVEEYGRALAECRTAAEKLATLSRLTGHPLGDRPLRHEGEPSGAPGEGVALRRRAVE